MLEAGVSCSKETNPWNCPVFIPCSGCMDHGISWDLMGSVPKAEILSHAIFICSCYHYFDLCLTSTFHYSRLRSSIFLLHPMIFQTLCLSVSCLPFSIHTSIPHLLTSIFHVYYYLPTICPFVTTSEYIQL